MHVLALALLLASDPGPDTDFYADEPAQKVSRIADTRYGAGATSLRDINGTAPTGEFGLELRPWGPVALRTSIGVAARYTWGTLTVTPEAVYRFSPLEATFSPYVAAGVQAGVINVRKEALEPQDGLQTLTAAATNDDPDPSTGDDTGRFAPGSSPLRFTAGPQVTAGVRFRAFTKTALDLGVRYNLVRWDGESYQGFSVVLAVCAPN